MPVLEPELTIYKDVDQDMVHRLEDLTFTIVVTNIGQGVAEGVVLTDEISGYLEYIRINASKGTATWSNGPRMVTVEIGVMNPGEVVTITITGRVVDIPAEELPVTITNMAFVVPFGPVAPIPSNEPVVPVVYFEPGEIPEPSTVFMLGSGLLSLAGYTGLRLRRRRRDD